MDLLLAVLILFSPMLVLVLGAALLEALGVTIDLESGRIRRETQEWRERD